MPPSPTILLLPGLDGTGLLYRSLMAAAPSHVRAVVVDFPVDQVLSRDELAAHARARIPDGPVVLVGESFSGPLALRLAKEIHPLGVLLCATFVKSPVPRWLTPTTLLAWCLKMDVPTAAVAATLTDGKHETAREVADALARVDRRVVASRLRMIVELDATLDLSTCPCPIAYIRGTRDRIVGQRSVQEITHARPDVDVIDFSAPHLVLQHDPAASWAAISAFAARWAGAAS